MELLPEKVENKVDVLWEDQQRINQFSKLYSKITVLKNDLSQQEKEKEYIDDVSLELELVDEDESVQYKLGDTFIYLPQSEVMERLEKESEVVNSEIEELNEKISDINTEMIKLKAALYSKFGDSIRLEK